jgi:hypothetical protein
MLWEAAMPATSYSSCGRGHAGDFSLQLWEAAMPATSYSS